MSTESYVWQKAMTLLDTAVSMHQKGELEDCLKLLDEAIHILEENNISSFTIRMEKALMASGTPADFTKIIPILLERENYCEINGLKIQQVKILSDLASCMSLYGHEHLKAITFIVKAEAILFKLKEGIIDQDKAYIKILDDDVNRVRLSIENRIKSE